MLMDQQYTYHCWQNKNRVCRKWIEIELTESRAEKHADGNRHGPLLEAVQCIGHCKEGSSQRNAVGRPFGTTERTPKQEWRGETEATNNAKVVGNESVEFQFVVENPLQFFLLLLLHDDSPRLCDWDRQMMPELCAIEKKNWGPFRASRRFDTSGRVRKPGRLAQR